MKKLVCWIMVLLVMLQPICVFAEGQTVTSLDTGDRNVLFSDGYRGFCIDRSRSGAYTGDTFTPDSSTASATNNNTQADISQSLKIMFTQCFADIFTADGNGGYAISDTNTVQAAVWHFSDDQYVWGAQKALTDAVKAYTGPEIPETATA